MTERIKEYVFDLFSQVRVTPAVDRLARAVFERAAARYRELLRKGVREGDAYDTAISEIGNLSGMIAETRKAESDCAAELRRRKRSRYITGGLIIASGLVPVLTLGRTKGYEDYGVALMLVILIIGVFTLISAAAARPDEVDVEYICRHGTAPAPSNDRPIYRLSSIVLWIITAVAYIAVGLGTGEWVLTLLIFAIGFCLNRIARATAEFFSVKRRSRR